MKSKNEIGNNKVEPIDKDEYIESLENLLIFMCQTHEDQHKALLGLLKEGNSAYMKVPTIQGTANLIPVSQIADIDFHRPEYGFREVKAEIERRRE